MIELCLKDCNKGKGIVSPCLKIKGHKGQHQHEEICKQEMCMCHWGKGDEKS